VSIDNYNVRITIFRVHAGLRLREPRAVEQEAWAWKAKEGVDIRFPGPRNLWFSARCWRNSFSAGVPVYVSPAEAPICEMAGAQTADEIAFFIALSSNARRQAGSQLSVGEKCQAHTGETSISNPWYPSPVGAHPAGGKLFSLCMILWERVGMDSNRSLSALSPGIHNHSFLSGLLRSFFAGKHY